jgi:hypothetical protein
MRDILAAYLMVNAIQPAESFLDAWKWIDHHFTNTVSITIYNYATQWYILEAYYDYLRWSLRLEEFMDVWDEQSTYSIYAAKDILYWVVTAYEQLLAFNTIHTSDTKPLVVINYVALQYAQARHPDILADLSTLLNSLQWYLCVLWAFEYHDTDTFNRDETIPLLP